MKPYLFITVLLSFFLACTHPNSASTGSEVSTGTISGLLLTDGQTIDYPVTVYLNYPDSNLSMAKRTASEKQPDDSITSTDGTYRFDSLSKGDYRIIVFNNEVLVGDTNVSLENDSDTAEVNISIINITIQIFNISNIQENNITINNFYIENGKIQATDNGYILTAEASDTLVFKAEFVMDGDTDTVSIQLTYDENGVAQFTIIGNKKELPVTVTPLPPPLLSGRTPTNSTTPTWYWSSENGIGTFRYWFDDNNFGDNAVETGDTSFTPDSALTEGTHTLYLQEKDTSGIWSTMAHHAITIDLTPPAAPRIMDSIMITNTTKPLVTWSPNDTGIVLFRFAFDDSALAVADTATDTFTVPHEPLSETTHTFYVRQCDFAGNWSAEATCKITVDTTTIGAPSVSGVTPTNNSTPTWIWSSGGGTLVYRYKLDDSALTSGATETADSSFTPENPLAEGAHTLYVQENDGFGNWSETGMFTIQIIQIDLTPPCAPEFTEYSSPSPTNNQRPTWVWRSVEGDGTFRYKFNSDDFSTGSTETGDTFYTSVVDLAEKTHTLYLQERDAAGNWSQSASYTIRIDTKKPDAPKFIDIVIETNIQKPLITWQPSDSSDACNHYRLKMDSSDFSTDATETNDTSYQVGNNLSEGNHTFYLQGIDSAGNWSESCSLTIIIDTTPPPTPVFDTNATTNSPTDTAFPIWVWYKNNDSFVYHYSIDDPNVDSTYPSTTDTFFTPQTALTEGPHTLFLMTRDKAGNLSPTTFHTITENFYYTVTWDSMRSCTHFDGETISCREKVLKNVKMKSGETIIITASPCYYICASGHGCSYYSFKNWLYNHELIELTQTDSYSFTAKLLKSENAVITVEYVGTSVECNQ